MIKNVMFYLKPGEYTIWCDKAKPDSILVFAAKNRHSNTYSVKALFLTPNGVDKLVGDSFIKIAQSDNYKEIGAYHGAVDGDNSIIWINPECVTNIEPTSKFSKEKISVRVGAIDNYIIDNPDYYELFGEFPKHTVQELNLWYLPCDWIVKHNLFDKCTATMRRRILAFLKLTALLKPLWRTLQERY